MIMALTLTDWISIIQALCALIGATFTTYTLVNLILLRGKTNVKQPDSNNGVSHNHSSNTPDGSPDGVGKN